MASDELISSLIAMNSAFFPHSTPQTPVALDVVMSVWRDELAPFTDAEVLAAGKKAMGRATSPLKPADIVPKLACARLGVIPWEEAYAEVCDLIDMRDGSFRRSPDSPQKRVADRMLSALQARTGEGSHALRAQFRDAYHAEVERMIDEEREPGGVLAIGAANAVKAIEAKP